MEKHPGAYGRFTHAPLCDVSALFVPATEDAWGYMRPAYSPQLMRLATELSAATYAFDFSRFFQSGWMDATLQVENRLFPQVDAWYARKTPHEFIRSGVRLHRAKSMLAPAFTDVLRAVRQLVATDTGKAVVMALPAEEGRFAIAVSFMGTGRKFYDWFTNFKLSCRGGVHEGFLNTARLFERNAERIEFPRVAQALGRRTLTLSDVLSECTQRESRFRLFLCGHSQGGAVAQAYCHLLRDEYALCMDNVVGYTLAAPTLVSWDFAENPAAYPLYHLINTDDLVPRMGARMRLGVDMRFTPDPAFRARHYGYAADSDPLPRAQLRRIADTLQTMPSLIEAAIAILRALSRLPDPADATAILHTVNAQFRYFAPAMQSLGLRTSDLVQMAEKRLLALCRELCGQSPEEARLSQLEGAFTRVIVRFGAQAFARAFGEITLAPHALMHDRPDHMAPYQAISARLQTLLRPCIHMRADAQSRLLPPPGAWFGTQAQDEKAGEEVIEISSEKQETASFGGNNERR